MSTFPQFMSCLAYIEGDESDISIDPGGYTIGGLSQGTRDRLNLGDNLTQAQIKDVYYREWWLRYGCDKLPPIMAWLVCDVFVNHKPETAATLIQRSLGTVKADGKYGPRTRAACAAVTDFRGFIETYAFHRRGHYARRTGVLLRRYVTQLNRATEAAVIKELEEKIQQVITQEHGWQNRPDRLFSGLWQAGLLKREPSPVKEVVQTTTAAVSAGTVVAVATGAMQSSGLGNTAQQVLEMAVNGDLTAVSAATMAAGYAYNKWIKGRNILPKWTKRLFSR